MQPLHNLTLLVGRIFIAAVFIFDASVIVRAPDSTAQFIASVGLPGQLALLVALCQFVGGVMVIFGVWTRLAAAALAAFCVSTALLFHRDLASTNEIIQAGKDFGLAGGFLFLTSVGPGAWSVDRFGRR